MVTSVFAVEGLTCGSCLAKVLESVSSLAGVTEVTMDLVTGGQSPLVITSGAELGVETVRAAIDNAGLDLGLSGRENGPRAGSELSLRAPVPVVWIVNE